jgi:hypothetical protein
MKLVHINFVFSLANRYANFFPLVLNNVMHKTLGLMTHELNYSGAECKVLMQEQYGPDNISGTMINGTG